MQVLRFEGAKKLVNTTVQGTELSELLVDTGPQNGLASAAVEE
jgi:hypothetical protein